MPLSLLRGDGEGEGRERKIKERDRVVSLFLSTENVPVYLSATNGNRVPETVIKVKRKPASALKHIGRNSMPLYRIRQELIFGTT